MLTTRQSLLDAIETAPDDVLEDLLGLLNSRLLHHPNSQRRKSFDELQKICQEENYSLEIGDRSDRLNPFVDEDEHVSL
jgi:hypothetical protein